MRVLWIVNTLFPKVSERIGVAAPISGGWMYGLADALVSDGQIELAVATVYSGIDLKVFKIDGVVFYLVPAVRPRNRDSYRRAWGDVVNDFNPNFLHVHGTEYRIGADFISFFPDLPYMVSIQGLVSEVAKHYLDGLDMRRVVRTITFRDVVRFDPLFLTARVFYKQSGIERSYIQGASSVLGRTEWDYAHVRAVSEHVEYFHLNESLRPEFYCDRKWSLSGCVRHSIFISQASYPIKGLHQLLSALSLLRRRFSDATVLVAGEDILAVGSIRDRLRRSGYANYIGSLIRDLRLEGAVRFLGPLNASAMREQYLKAHAFVCPSSIENSPNSLGEAQILGVPCIASYVGGIPSMVEDGASALLYAFDEPEILANKLSLLFENDRLAKRLSDGGYQSAVTRHDKDQNLSRLLCIYQDFLSKFSV